MAKADVIKETTDKAMDTVTACVAEQADLASKCFSLYQGQVEKAAKLYAAVDATDFYSGTAHPDHRSDMNVTFALANSDLEAAFLAEADAHNLKGLKGHRSVGGLRASIYNAFPVEGVDALISFMKEFEATHG